MALITLLLDLVFALETPRAAPVQCHAAQPIDRALRLSARVLMVYVRAGISMDVSVIREKERG